MLWRFLHSWQQICKFGLCRSKHNLLQEASEQRTINHYIVDSLQGLSLYLETCCCSLRRTAGTTSSSKNLIERTGASEQCQLQHLLTAEELGTGNPCSCCTECTNCLGEKSGGTDGSIIRELLMQRLPTNTRFWLLRARNSAGRIGHTGRQDQGDSYTLHCHCGCTLRGNKQGRVTVCGEYGFVKTHLGPAGSTNCAVGTEANLILPCSGWSVGITSGLGMPLPNALCRVQNR